VVPDCLDCYEPLSTCVHRSRYLQVEGFVADKGIRIVDASRIAPESAWLGSEVLLHANPIEIRVWSTASRIYGWSMLTSALIHEFGHCELYRIENAYERSIENERKANQYGYRFDAGRSHTSFLLGGSQVRPQVLRGGGELDRSAIPGRIATTPWPLRWQVTTLSFICRHVLFFKNASPLRALMSKFGIGHPPI
jgi:hypothetical protein